MTNKTPEALFTTQQVAAALNASDRWVRMLIERGEIPAVRLSNRLRVPESAWQALCDGALGGAAVQQQESDSE